MKTVHVGGSAHVFLLAFPLTASAAEKTWRDELKISPLKGPVAEATPGIILKGTSTSNRKMSEGTISYSMPEGVVCEEKWATKFDEAMPTRRARGSHPHIDNITQIGPGSADDGQIAIRHQGGGGGGEGTCSNGAAFILFVVNGVRVIKDSNGNIYKILR